jgi:hypothetical protein
MKPIIAAAAAPFNRPMFLNDAEELDDTFAVDDAYVLGTGTLFGYPAIDAGTLAELLVEVLDVTLTR